MLNIFKFLGGRGSLLAYKVYVISMMVIVFFAVCVFCVYSPLLFSKNEAKATTSGATIAFDSNLFVGEGFNSKINPTVARAILNAVGGEKFSGVKTRAQLETADGEALVFSMGYALDQYTNTKVPLQWEIVRRDGNVLTLWLTRNYTQDYFQYTTSWSGLDTTDYVALYGTYRSNYSKSTARAIVKAIYNEVSSTYPVINDLVVTAKRVEMPETVEDRTLFADYTVYQDTQPNSYIWTTTYWSCTNGMYQNPNTGSGINNPNSNNVVWDSSVYEDEFWLPSYYEVYAKSNNPEINEVNTWNGRLNYDGGFWEYPESKDTYFNSTLITNSNVSVDWSWTRSSYYGYDRGSLMVGHTGDSTGAGGEAIRGIRPAMHISLEELFLASLGDNIINTDGSVNAQSIKTIIAKFQGMGDNEVRTWQQLKAMNNNAPLMFKMGYVPSTMKDLVWEVVYKENDVVTVWMYQNFVNEYYLASGSYSGLSSTNFLSTNNNQSIANYSRSTARGVTNVIWNNGGAVNSIMSTWIVSPQMASQLGYYNDYHSFEDNTYYYNKNKTDWSIMNNLNNNTNSGSSDINNNNPNNMSWDTSVYNDYLWIPSYYEVFNKGSLSTTSQDGNASWFDGGLWGFSSISDLTHRMDTYTNNQVASGVWLRSGRYGANNQALTLTQSGVTSKTLTTVNGLRPATILNFRVLASYVTSVVTLEKSGGTEGDSRVNVNYGQVMPSINIPVKTDHKFLGYFSQPNGEGVQYYNENGYSVSTWDRACDAVIYADWLNLVRDITFDANGGNLEGDSQIKRKEGEIFTLPNVTKVGYHAYWVDTTVEGMGTPISSRSDLMNLANSNGTYYLTTNIDLSGEEWEPLADFTGILDGRGFSIRNMTINNSTREFVGLFARINGAVISNLFMENVNITSNRHIGSISGYGYGTITNCKSSGTMNLVTNSIWRCAGGLIGQVNGGALHINNCTNYTNIFGAGPDEIHVAGIIGYMYQPSYIVNCVNLGNMTLTDNITPYASTGGIMSVNNGYCEIRNCINAGDITSSNIAGGIMGYHYQVDLSKNCFNIGTITARENCAYQLMGNGAGNLTQGYYLSSVSTQINQGTPVDTLAELMQIFYNNMESDDKNSWNYTPGQTELLTIKEFVDNLSGNIGEVKVFKGVRDRNLKAEWTINTYTILYNGTGATSGEMAPTVCTYDSQTSLRLNAFIWTGYRFLGWAYEPWSSVVTFVDGESVLNLTAQNLGEVTLYAVWESVMFNVYYNQNFTISGALDAGAFGYMLPSYFQVGKEYTLPTNGYVYNGYEFLGWSKNANDTTPSYKDNEVVSDLSIGGEDCNLYAIWKKKEIKTSLNANGGVITSANGWTLLNANRNATITKEHGQTATLPTPTKEGYAFVGWVPTTTLNGETYYQVYYHDNQGGTCLFSSVQEAKTTNSQYKYSILSDMTMLQQGEEIYTFWIEFDYIEGYNNWRQSVNPTEIYIQETSTGEAFAPGYEAISISWNSEYWGGLTRYSIDPDDAPWCYLSGSVGHQYWFYSMGSKATHGVGTPSSTLASISYPNGYVQSFSGSTPYGTNLYQKAIDITGDFTGNLSQLMGGSTWYFRNKDVTLTALWKPIEYSVRYNGNGATKGAMSDSKHIYNKEANLSKNEFARRGFEFLGWSLNKDDKVTTYLDLGLVKNLTTTADSTVTLYAIWEYKGNSSTTVTVTATYGGRAVIVGEDYTTANAIRFEAVACVDGYTFLGWYRLDKQMTLLSTNPLESFNKTDVWNYQIEARFVNAVGEVLGGYSNYADFAFHTVAVSTTLGGSAGIVGENYSSLADSDTISLFATQLNSGYKFVGWYDVNGESELLLSTEISVKLNKSQITHKQIEARFEQILLDPNINDILDN